jgi:nicotinate-nucleotide adenylyltransferase
MDIESPGANPEKLFSRAEKLLKKYIKKKRIKHCKSTAKFMQDNAAYFQINPDKAYLAGLLHDIAKELSTREIVQLTEQFQERNIYHVKFLHFKRENPVLLHGVASAEIMCRELGITDQAILQSACQHTLGGIQLSRLAKFTFISDYCEPLRSGQHAAKVRNSLVDERNFDKALFYKYYYIIQDFLGKKYKICVETVEGYNDAVKWWNFTKGLNRDPFV